MTYNTRVPAYALNSYVWKLLEANLGWKKSDYEGAVPIIPASQQPELMQSGRTFIVYGAARHPSEHLYQLAKGAVSYTIYSPSVTEANKVVALLADTFARQDEAASDVNDWLVTEGEDRSGGHRGIYFATIRTIMVENAEPADEEGGFVSALIMVEMKYTQDSAEIQTNGFSYTP